MLAHLVRALDVDAGDPRAKLVLLALADIAGARGGGDRFRLTPALREKAMRWAECDFAGFEEAFGYLREKRLVLHIDEGDYEIWLP